MLVDLFYYRNLDEEQTKEVAEDNVEVEEELAEVLFILINFYLIMVGRYFCDDCFKVYNF